MASESEVEQALAQSRQLLQSSDPVAAVRSLRVVADQVPLIELLDVVESAARFMEFPDWANAAAIAKANPNDPAYLYHFGYACIEKGVSFLAIPVLSVALQNAPKSNAILMELVTAFEDESRHVEAVLLLEKHELLLDEWMNRYLLAYNAMFSGDAPKARRVIAGLERPDDERLLFMHRRMQSMIMRLDAVTDVTSLDTHDLRGWHFVLHAGLLGTISPFGFNAGMSGRYAYLQDTFSFCRYGIERLRSAIASSGHSPKSISLLPDRSSHILGLAVSEILNLPTRPFRAEEQNTVIVAHNLSALDSVTLAALQPRVNQQILFEHATCWTEPPPVSADFSTAFHQVVVAPWDERLAYDVNTGSATQAPADDRPVEILAAHIVSAELTVDEGDGESPVDSDEQFVTFVAAARTAWAEDDGLRDRVRSPGPVRSNRFA